MTELARNPLVRANSPFHSLAGRILIVVLNLLVIAIVGQPAFASAYNEMPEMAYSNIIALPLLAFVVFPCLLHVFGRRWMERDVLSELYLSNLSAREIAWGIVLWPLGIISFLVLAIWMRLAFWKWFAMANGHQSWLRAIDVLYIICFGLTLLVLGVALSTKLFFLKPRQRLHHLALSILFGLAYGTAFVFVMVTLTQDPSFKFLPEWIGGLGWLAIVCLLAFSWRHRNSRRMFSEYLQHELADESYLDAARIRFTDKKLRAATRITLRNEIRSNNKEAILSLVAGAAAAFGAGKIIWYYYYRGSAGDSSYFTDFQFATIFNLQFFPLMLAIAVWIHLNNEKRRCGGLTIMKGAILPSLTRHLMPLQIWFVAVMWAAWMYRSIAMSRSEHDFIRIGAMGFLPPLIWIVINRCANVLILGQRRGQNVFWALYVFGLLLVYWRCIHLQARNQYTFLLWLKDGDISGALIAIAFVLLLIFLPSHLQRLHDQLDRDLKVGQMGQVREPRPR